MNKFIKISIAPILAVLSSCSTSSDSVTDSVEVVTISGNIISLDGVYESCSDLNLNPGSSEKYRLNFNKTTLEIQQTFHQTEDCTGPGSDDDFIITTSLSKGQTSTIFGWVDHDGVDSEAPVAGDNTGPLLVAEPVTLIDATITKSQTVEDIGVTIETFFVVDDTGDTLMLYLDDDDETTGRFAVSNTPVTKI